MKGFLGKLFGGKNESSCGDKALDLVADVLETVIDTAHLDLSFDIERNEKTNDINIEIFGEDEEKLVAREGQLIDAFQLYIKRVVQHQVPDERVNINIDSNGFREEVDQSVIKLAEKLKGICVDKGKPVYFRALPPRERKIVHQYLAEDGRVKSRSVGDGLYKKIKIYPIHNGNTESKRAHS